MKKRILRSIKNYNIKKLFQDFVKTLAVYLVATGCALALNAAAVMNDNIFGVYMLAVAIISVTTESYIWGVLASVGGVIGVNFFFTFPYFALNFSIAGYPVTFMIMLLMSVLASFLTAKVKFAAIISAEGKKRAETLTEMSQAMLTASDYDTIAELAADYLNKTNLCSVVVYLGSPMEPDIVKYHTLNETDETIFKSVLEQQVALSAYESGKTVGADVHNGSQNCKGTYFPIKTPDFKYGVVGFLFDDTKVVLKDMYSYIDVMISQTILALQKQEMTEQAQEILLETEKEKMRSNLLRAVSHDLRTPLTGIVGSASTLIENEDRIDREVGRKMLRDIQQDAEWLIHMVENLLSVTRISGGTTSLKKQDEIVEEVVSEAVLRIRKRFPDSRIDVTVPDELLIVPMDATLIEQVLINLMENSIRHSDSPLPISLKVSGKKSGAVFTISDQGKGIDPSRIPDIFDGKANKGSSDSSRGLGIGLSICKSIILAHDGKIFAENNISGGARFTFVLPMKGDNDYA
jgi:two-component system sensor histidine kinase KdpD